MPRKGMANPGDGCQKGALRGLIGQYPPTKLEWPSIDCDTMNHAARREVECRSFGSSSGRTPALNTWN